MQYATDICQGCLYAQSIVGTIPSALEQQPQTGTGMQHATDICQGCLFVQQQPQTDIGITIPSSLELLFQTGIGMQDSTDIYVRSFLFNRCWKSFHHL
jgi:hypothetical protein